MLLFHIQILDFYKAAEYVNVFYLTQEKTTLNIHTSFKGETYTFAFLLLKTIKKLF